MGHGIVPDHAGWGTFGWLIVVFLLGTIVFALSLQVIIGRLRRAEKGVVRLFLAAVGRALGRKDERVVEVQPLAHMNQRKILQSVPSLPRRKASSDSRPKDEENGTV